MELPSVVGAFVREDIYGHPREVHLLIAAGPHPAHFARDVRELLEERLGVPIDQRVISIAQLAKSAEAALPQAPRGAASPVPVAEEAAPEEPPAPEPPVDVRLRFLGAQTEVSAGRIIARVRVERGGVEYTGEAIEMEAGGGRVRAGALAALRAASAASSATARFELEAASTVRACARDYVLVSALANAAVLGRQPLELTGAHPADPEPATAAALAALKAVNRVAALVIRLADSAQGSPRMRRRR